jgi:hypothetical protein
MLQSSSCSHPPPHKNRSRCRVLAWVSPVDREALWPRLTTKTPFQHADVPFYFEDVFDWALGVFAYEERLSFWPGEHEIKPRSYHRFPSLTAARTEALRRVADLEAQLARREAELEGRYETARHPPSSRSHATAQSASWSSPARNEALKHEVAGLMQKVRASPPVH